MMNRTALQLYQSGFDHNKGPKCPYCGEFSKLVSSDHIYAYGNYGNVWKCPVCVQVYVGTHKNGEWKDYPLGSLANEDLRIARRRAHHSFDILWKSKYMSRSLAYRLLYKELNLSPEDAHIAEFDIDLCNKVHDFVVAFLERRKSLGEYL